MAKPAISDVRARAGRHRPARDRDGRRTAGGRGLEPTDGCLAFAGAVKALTDRERSSRLWPRTASPTPKVEQLIGRPLPGATFDVSLVEVIHRLKRDLEIREIVTA